MLLLEVTALNVNKKMGDWVMEDLTSLLFAELFKRAFFYVYLQERKELKPLLVKQPSPVDNNRTSLLRMTLSDAFDLSYSLRILSKAHS